MEAEGMKKKNRKQRKIKEIQAGKKFVIFAGIAILVILCSDVFGDEEQNPKL